ncbi:sensor histidine kinase [Actinoplanes sp. CA-252034]|uniref:sensor histidine kinase n=1 Tax=Actinoplanes sp. CA-252034 TaxID=3239906 RepID=UPI003D99DD16
MPALTTSSRSRKSLSPGRWTALSWLVGTTYAVATSVGLPRPQAAAPVDWRIPALVLAGTTMLTLVGATLLRRHPLVASTLLLAGAVGGASIAGPGGVALPQFLAFYVALAFIAASSSRRTAIISGFGTAGVFGVYQAARLMSGWGVAAAETLVVLLGGVAAWLIGRSVHERREHAEALRARTTTDAINAERLRIARELHDMVAHNIGIVALQAGSANLVIDTQPHVARQALRSIEAAGRETLAGLRHMLVALREAGREPGGPAPRLDDLDRLAKETNEAGLRVDLRWLGDRRALPVEVDLSAYRIIQEAITNVVRHAGARSCQVSVDYRDEELAIDVLDDGKGLDGEPRPGYGLIGMRERVGLLHGDFSARPDPGGGFRVSARLPTTTRS